MSTYFVLEPEAPESVGVDVADLGYIAYETVSVETV